MTCQELKTKSDGELVTLIKDLASDDAFLEVCTRYENIFYSVCQKYASALTNSGVNPEDIFEEKNCIILHCISTYQPEKKAKLGTWIGNYARYLCLNSINSRRFILPTTDEELKHFIENSQIYSEYSASQTDKAEDFKYIQNLLGQIKDARIVEIFKYRYLSQKRMIWADIAEKLNVSTQTVINLHNKGLDLLQRKLKSRSISDVI